MKINGDLEVLGELTVRIKEIEDYTFDGEDKGLILLDADGLYFNNGSAVLRFETTNRTTTLTNALGSWINQDFAFNPLAFNENFTNINGLNSGSTLLDALQQLDTAIPRTYVESFGTAASTHTVNHNLNSDIAHVTVKKIYGNQKVKDSEMTISFTSSNSLKIDLTSELAVKVLVSTV